MSQLLHLGEELRALFAEERRAISSLDHAALGQLAERKREVAARLAELGELRTDPAARALFEAIRVEAQATALLAAAATESVRALLGYQSTGQYDRRARTVTAGPGRILATY